MNFMRLSLHAGYILRLPVCSNSHWGNDVFYCCVRTNVIKKISLVEAVLELGVMYKPRKARTPILLLYKLCLCLFLSTGLSDHLNSWSPNFQPGWFASVDFVMNRIYKFGTCPYSIIFCTIERFKWQKNAIQVSFPCLRDARATRNVF